MSPVHKFNLTPSILAEPLWIDLVASYVQVDGRDGGAGMGTYSNAFVLDGMKLMHCEVAMPISDLKRLSTDVADFGDDYRIDDLAQLKACEQIRIRFCVGDNGNRIGVTIPDYGTHELTAGILFYHAPKKGTTDAGGKVWFVTKTVDEARALCVAASSAGSTCHVTLEDDGAEKRCVEVDLAGPFLACVHALEVEKRKKSK